MDLLIFWSLLGLFLRIDLEARELFLSLVFSGFAVGVYVIIKKLSAMSWQCFFLRFLSMFFFFVRKISEQMFHLPGQRDLQVSSSIKFNTQDSSSVEK